MTQREKSIDFDGFHWELRLPSNLDTEFANGAWWDKDVHDWIVQQVKPGMCCVDAGANFGPFTMLLSRCAGPKGWVYAFEPCPSFFTRLQRHIELNKLENVTAKQMALRDKAGPAICVMSAGPEFSTAFVRDSVADGSGSAVESIPLDEFWQTRGPLDFMKIDVDGCEMELLLGAEGVICEHKPSMVIEIPLASEGIEIGGWLRDHGYKLLDHRGYELTEAHLGHSKNAGTMNVLAVHKESR